MKPSSRWIRITQCEDIPLREGRAVEVDGREIAIFNLGDRFLAIENRCPHRGGPLADGIVSGSTVVCPLHAWKVQLETGVVAKPPEQRACVATYPVRIQNGVLSVQIPAASDLVVLSFVPCVPEEQPLLFEATAG